MRAMAVVVVSGVAGAVWAGAPTDANGHVDPYAGYAPRIIHAQPLVGHAVAKAYASVPVPGGTASFRQVETREYHQPTTWSHASEALPFHRRVDVSYTPAVRRWDRPVWASSWRQNPYAYSRVTYSNTWSSGYISITHQRSDRYNRYRWRHSPHRPYCGAYPSYGRSRYSESSGGNTVWVGPTR